MSMEIPNDPKSIGNCTYIFTNISNVQIKCATIYKGKLLYRQLFFSTGASLPRLNGANNGDNTNT